MGSDDPGSLAARRDTDFCLLMPCSGCPDIPEVDQGGSPGAKAGDADLDYEIVDRAGERILQPLQPPHHPQAGLAEPKGQ